MHRLIVWSPEAKRDLHIFLEYLKIKWDNKTTNHFIDSTEIILNQILTNPKQFPVISGEKKFENVLSPSIIHYTIDSINIKSEYLEYLITDKIPKL